MNGTQIVTKFAKECELEKRENRLPVLLTDEELRRVQDYRWRNRIRSQQEATRQLIERGLAAETKAAEVVRATPAE